MFLHDSRGRHAEECAGTCVANAIDEQQLPCANFCFRNKSLSPAFYMFFHDTARFIRSGGVSPSNRAIHAHRYGFRPVG